MSRALRPNYQYGVNVKPSSVSPGEFLSKTLTEGEEITIWFDKVPADKVYTWGVGPNDRQAGNANFTFAEFLASGAGAGTDGDVIRDADVVLAITDSTREDTLAKTTLGRAGDLADAQADNPSDRPILAEHAPAATEDRHLEIRLRAGSGADGVEVAQDSNVSLKYGIVG